MPLISCPVLSVHTDDHLKQLCAQWLNSSMLAIDTEFMRTNTFFPKPALVQIHDGQANYLIDPLRIRDWAPLVEVVSETDSLKVFHACSEDLEVFHRLLGVVPNNLFDTQLAAAFAGKGFSIGYGNLVEELLRVQLPKDETRSDWLQRPLTEAQLDYAAMDVEYLFSIAEILLQHLRPLGRLSWVLDEGQALVESFRESQKPENAALRFRAAWRLSARQLALLQRLATWRDFTAQQRNIPRNHVIHDKILYALAENQPTHVAQLRKVVDLSDKAIRRYGEQIVALVQEVQSLDDSVLPEPLSKPPSSRQKATVRLLREKLSEVAEQLDIAAEVLARKKDYEYIALAADRGAEGEDLLPPGLASWRVEYVKPVVLKYL